MTINSSTPSAAYMCQWSGLTLVQVMVCRLLDAKPFLENKQPQLKQWQWKVIEKTSIILDTPPQDKLHKHLQISNACEHSCLMIMVGSKMSKTEYDLKAIMYPAYDTPHKLCNIRGN